VRIASEFGVKDFQGPNLAVLAGTEDLAKSPVTPAFFKNPAVQCAAGNRSGTFVSFLASGRVYGLRKLGCNPAELFDLRIRGPKTVGAKQGFLSGDESTIRLLRGPKGNG
jgi:hypothetical protein